MKYLAILKDSLREALDTKVLYVMIGLAALVALFTACLSFKPKSVTDFSQLLTATLYLDPDKASGEDVQRTLMHNWSRPGEIRYEIVGQQPLEDGADGPHSKFVFTVRAHSDSKENADAASQKVSEVESTILRRFGRLGAAELVRVSEVRPAGANAPGLPAKPDASDVFFEVHTQPTRATVRLWPHEISLFFGSIPLFTAPLGLQLYGILAFIVLGMGGWVIILVSVIMTAFFIPNMLRKGTVDMLLAKPIQRGTLLLYKYTGGLIFIFLNTAVTVLAMWLVLGLRSGIWANSFLLSIFVYTFFFAILYSVSTLFAVLTRSPIAAILITLGVWFILYLVGVGYAVFDNQRHIEEVNQTPVADRWGDNTFGKVINVVHFVLPRTKDLDILQDSLLQSDLFTDNETSMSKLSGSSVTWAESLTASLVFIAIMLGLSTLWFVTRDY